MTHYLFDFDGTLGNTLPLCVAAFREALEPLAPDECGFVVDGVLATDLQLLEALRHLR